jgi:hypothetical protein
MKKLYQIICLSFFIFSANIFAAEWHEAFSEGFGGETIKEIAMLNNDFNQLIAIGEDGGIYRSWSAGSHWQNVHTAGERLRDVKVFLDTELGAEVIIVVGENGYVARSGNLGSSWFEPTVVNSANFTSVVYNSLFGTIWASSDDGTVWISFDSGVNWSIIIPAIQGLNVVDMASSANWVYLLSVRNDTSFIFEVDPYYGTYLDDADPAINLVFNKLEFRDSPNSEDLLFMTGSDAITGEAVAYYRDVSEEIGSRIPVFREPGLTIANMDWFSVFEGGEQSDRPIDILWLTTSVGEIWESTDLGVSWRRVYSHFSGQPVTALVSNHSTNYDNGLALAVSLGYSLKYSFEMEFISPNMGDQFSHELNEVRMYFSARADLPSVENGIAVVSNLSGRMPVRAEYSFYDSQEVVLIVNRPFTNRSSVPGEKWTISLVDTIIAYNGNGAPSSVRPFNINTQFLPFVTGILDFSPGQVTDTVITNSSTNIVTGFFNQDSYIDAITFSDGYLNIMETDGLGNIINIRQHFLPLDISVTESLKDQLLTADLNNDGLLDLIFYDNYAIYSILNQSSTIGFTFTPSATHYSNNIRQIKIMNANHNQQPDLLILNDTLTVRPDISENSFGSSYIIDIYPPIEKLDVDDIDLNGNDDIVGVSSDGLYFYRAFGNLYFEIPQYFNGNFSYSDLKLADLDLDKRPEVIAYNNLNIDIWTYNDMDSTWFSLTAISPLSQQATSNISDLIVQDFGGIENTPGQRLMDIAILTEDSTIKFFENSSFIGGFNIDERPEKEVRLNTAADHFVYWTRDNFLDILTIDKNSGAIQNVINDTWVPEITLLSAGNDGVHISWEQFPVVLGDFIEYRLIREPVGFDQQNGPREFVFNNINQVNFIDIETIPFGTYNYFVTIVYNIEGNNIVTTGPGEFIELINIISGPISGALSDSVSGYLVQDSVVVLTGESLIINGNVQMAFAQDARFNVYGQLDVRGSGNQLIGFDAYRDYYYGEEITWQGINLFPGADTVSFEWFSINRANVGINAIGRPFKTYLGAISRNNTAIYAEGDTVSIKNIILDSNQVAINLGQNSRALLKNLNILGNINGVNANVNARGYIKNSIIWNNQNNVNLLAGSDIQISYSTVQNINGAGTFTNINSINAPIYVNQEDDIPYRQQPNSPTMDSGDPADDFSQEPMPNGGRINQGFLGGTFLATQSIRPGNTAPYLVTNPPVQTYVNQEYVYIIRGADDQNDDIVVEQVVLPQWLSFNGDNTFSGTPAQADLGNHNISFVLRDWFGGVSSPNNFTISVLEPQVLNAPTNLVLTAMDQAIGISFTMPPAAGLDPYDGTYIYITNDTVALEEAETFILIDTTLTPGSTPQFTIENLSINQTYYVGIINYSLSDTDIFSIPLMGSITTLAPSVELINVNRTYQLPVNKQLTETVILKNTGGGTLLGRFSYQPNSLLDVWFDIDTTQKVISPGDSATIEFNLHPNKNMPRGQKLATIFVLNNSAVSNMSFTITLDPVFDDFAPNVVVTAREDSVVRQSAFSVHFYADDTTGYPIGEPEDSLTIHYRLLKGQGQNASVFMSGDSLQVNNLLLYPLEDDFYNLVIWASDPDDNIKPLEERTLVRFEINASERSIARNRWHMLTIPRPVEVVWQNYVRDSISQIYRWDNTEDRYLAIQEFTQQNHPAGEAVWVISKNNFNINVSQFNQAGLNDTLTVPIDSGWNQIGTPLTYFTAWTDMAFIPDGGPEISLSEAVEQGLLDAGVHWYRYYDNGSSGYETHLIDDTSETALAIPWRGYFIKSEVNGSLKFSTIASDFLEIESRQVTFAAKIATAAPSTFFNISLNSDGYNDNHNIFGISGDGKIHDAHEPPHMGSYSALYFKDNDKRLIRKIHEGFTSYDEVKEWNLVVESHNANQNHLLKWDAEQLSVSGIYFYLVDFENEKFIEMNNTNEYKFKPGNFKRDFIVYASRDASFRPKIIPADFRLKQNYPNPFNPFTTIRFGVPEKMAGQKISLKIYNVLGQQITDLFNQSFEAGFHEVKWNGLNKAGQTVSSGVYFYKLNYGSSSLTRKMILLR